MAKLLKLRRGSTSQHGSFTGAEGEVTVDTTKDVLVVHDGSTAGGHPMAAQDMDNVPAGSILGTQLENSGVTAGQYGSSSAIPIVTVDAQGLVTAASTTAIDSTTIANGSASVAVASNGPITSNANHDFSAGIDVTGAITSTGNMTITNDAPKIFLTDGSNNPDFSIQNANGAFVIFDDTNSAVRLEVNADGHVDVKGNLDCEAGVDVTGNITTTGNIFTGDNQYYYVGDANDGRYYHDGSNTYLEETGTGELRLASLSGPGVRITKGGSETLANFTNDGSCELYFDNVKKLETTSSGVSVTGNIASTGTITSQDITIQDQQPRLNFVDNAGSPNNPDYLFQVDGGQFVLHDSTNGANKITVESNGVVTIPPNCDFGAGIDVTGSITVTGNVDGRDVAADGSKLDGIESGATADQSASEILTLIKTVDGSGSGLDADSLDGIGSGSFARSDANDTLSGIYNISSKKLGLGIVPGNSFGNRNAAFCIGDNDTGFAQNGDGQLEAWANNTLRFLWTSGDILSYGTFRPASNNSVDLGTSTFRWRNVFTNDLNLSNEGGANDVDGSWGDWTIQEGESDLFLKNNRSGKKYKFNLTEVS